MVAAAGMSDAEDSRRWRANHPDRAAEHRRRHRVRQRALALLAKVHPEDFAALTAAVEADMAEEDGR
jgi:hypothetical protein